MNIGIEAQRLFRPKKHGMEIVLLETLLELQKLNTSEKFSILVKKDKDRTCINPSSSLHIYPLRTLPYPLWEQFLLPMKSKKLGLDLLHCTSNTAPIYSKTPFIVTIHDLIFIERLNFSGSAYQNFGNLYRRIIVPIAANNAKLIITVSEFTKSRIASTLKIPEGKIRVIYNGLANSYRVIEDTSLLNSFKHENNLPDKYLLHFSNTEPRKNTIGTLNAFIEYSRNTHNDIHLVLVNCPQDRLQKMLRKLGAPEFFAKIHCLNYVPSSKLPLLYNAASLLLYPSLYEGFGMPVIESMACGTPVITSNCSSLPEISGNAAILVNPNDFREIASAIRLLLEDSQRYITLKKLGLENVKRFSWEKTASQLLETYKELAIS